MEKELSKAAKKKLFLSGLLILVVLSSIFGFFEVRSYYLRRESYLYLAANQSKLIEGSLDNVMSRVYSLRSLVKTNGGDTSFFEISVPEIYEETLEDTGLYVRNFILAPDGVVTDVYPLEGNEDLIGFNYMDESQMGNQAAVQSYTDRKMVLTEPFALKQGGTGIAGRLPVFLEDGEYWGMVAVTLDLDELMREFNLSYLDETGADYCLSYRNADGEKVVLAASKTEPRDPIVSTMSPRNLEWTLQIAPHNGWVPMSEVLIGGLIVLLITALLMRILQTRAKIRSMNVLLEELAIRDNLTGCYSRHYVNEILLMSDGKKWKDPNACYSLAVIDVDYFKKINDTYGHSTGDLALKKIAETLLGLCDDLRGDCVIRYGGDEFVLLLNNVSMDLLENRVEKAVQAVRAIRLSGAEDLRLSVSVGAVHGKKDETYHDLFARADKQVYLSKMGGKDCAHVEGLVRCASSQYEKESRHEST